MTILSYTRLTYHCDQVFDLTHTFPVIGQGLKLTKLVDTLLIINIWSGADGKSDGLKYHPEGCYIGCCIYRKSHTIRRILVNTTLFRPGARTTCSRRCSSLLLFQSMKYPKYTGIFVDSCWKWVLPQSNQVYSCIAAGSECYHSHIISKHDQRAIIVILSMVQFWSDLRLVVKSMGLINCKYKQVKGMYTDTV